MPFSIKFICKLSIFIFLALSGTAYSQTLHNSQNNDAPSMWEPVTIADVSCKATASSTIDQDHSISKAFSDHHQSWVGNHQDGMDEWIEIQCDKTIPISWIMISYEWKNNEIYNREYSRAKKLTIEIDEKKYDSFGESDSTASYWKIINHKQKDFENKFITPIDGKNILISINDIYPGSTHKNISIDTINIFPVFEGEEKLDIKPEKTPSFYLDYILGIALGDRNSRRRFLIKHGPGIAIANVEYMVAYSNRDNTQKLLLSKLPGSYVYEGFSNIYVSYNLSLNDLIDNYPDFIPELHTKINRDYLWELGRWDDNIKDSRDAPLIKEDIFESDKGIRLGISPETLIGILGRPHIEVNIGKNKVIAYSVPYGYNGDITEYKSIETYLGEYIFNNDKLVWMKTGYEYP